MLKKGRGYLYDITYYIAWYTYDKTSILDDYSLSLLNNILYDIANDNNFIISNSSLTSNYIYLELCCKPQHYIPTILKLLKGISARRLFTINPNLKKFITKGHLWQSDYYVTTHPDKLGMFKVEKTREKLELFDYKMEQLEQQRKQRDEQLRINGGRSI